MPSNHLILCHLLLLLPSVFLTSKAFSNKPVLCISLHTGYSEHQQALSQLDAETLVLKESERKWEEGLISVFQLMEARNRFIAAKAELVRVRLQIEMMMKLEKYYRQGTFL